MKLAAAALLFITLALPIDAKAAPPAGCVILPLPTTPLPPVYTATILWHSDQAKIELWRQPCVNNASQFAALVRFTPITTGPFICSVNFFITQAGTQFQGLVQTNQSIGSSFCADLPAPQTLLLTEAFGAGRTLNVVDGFSVVHDGGTSTQVLEVPPLGGSLPPTLTVVATGCTTCHSGQVVGYNMNIPNPGPPTPAELKGGVRLPDGTILPFVNQVTTLPSGASVMPLVPTQALPGGLPAIDVVIEAAILEPSLGVTLSRHNVTLHLLP